MRIDVEGLPNCAYEDEPVDISVPFKEGAVSDLGVLHLVGPGRRKELFQARSLACWPDGSQKWALVSFLANVGKGKPAAYELSGPARRPSSDRRSERPLGRETSSEIEVDTGAMRFRVRKASSRFIEDLRVRGQRRPLCRDASIVLTDPTGNRFAACLGRGRGSSVTLAENGPVRAVVCCRGAHFDSSGSRCMHFVLRLYAYRGQTKLRVTYTLVNRDPQPSRLVRDLRIDVGRTNLDPVNVALGTDRGEFCEPLGERNIHLLQDDHDTFRAYQDDGRGKAVPLVSGGVSGRRAPGWLGLSSDSSRVLVAVPNFWKLYPKELGVTKSAIRIGLWPSRAAGALAAKTVLPARNTEDPWGRHAPDSEGCSALHPYVSCFCPERQALEVVYGMAKTHDVVIDFAADRKEPWVEQAQRLLEPPVATLSATEYRKSGVYGDFQVGGNRKLAKYEDMLTRAAEWVASHGERYHCYGAIDYGDLRHVVFMPFSSPSGATMRKPVREAGWWNNNDNDVLRAVLFHSIRTGEATFRQLGYALARHTLDSDLCRGSREGAKPGMYAPSDGHCFRARGRSGSFDELWLEGIAEYYFLTGDELAAEALDLLMSVALDQAQSISVDTASLRTVGMALRQLVGLCRYRGKDKLLRAAERVVADLVARQNNDGSWLSFGARTPDHNAPKSPHFLSVALRGLVDYHALSGEERVESTLDRAVDWQIKHGLTESGDAFVYSLDPDGPRPHPVTTFEMLGILVYMAEISGAKRYLKIGEKCLRRLEETQWLETEHPEMCGTWECSADSKQVRPDPLPACLYYTPFLLRQLATPQSRR